VRRLHHGLYRGAVLRVRAVGVLGLGVAVAENGGGSTLCSACVMGFAKGLVGAGVHLCSLWRTCCL
jgi:hypothetical protein